jgi:hypothetical protein
MGSGAGDSRTTTEPGRPSDNQQQWVEFDDKESSHADLN